MQKLGAAGRMNRNTESQTRPTGLIQSIKKLNLKTEKNKIQKFKIEGSEELIFKDNL